MDLNDWLRGERDWRDLWDLKDLLPMGSRYRSAKLRDPDIVDHMAAQPDPDDIDVPIEGFDIYIQHLVGIEDRLTQLLYITGAADPSTAPRSPRPRWPHLKRREELRKQHTSNLTNVYRLREAAQG
ncbi:hypothetical protein D5S18_18650 [Nocardia panacis]|uniref:Uncharacterized protein n=1 Tax=Nocardia panacis TaxID=2340916 RepID=A0A3A4KMF7_9NOCA|nr:hypothetical protein [Nocardia panacis]RJO74174.1 hypothetical protein D5S18_18650 [Nocardia panacis]